MKKIISIGIYAILLIGCTETMVVEDRRGAVVYGPPPWAPAYGYRAHCYYFPDIEVYYYVPTAEFMYWNGAVWVYTVILPVIYSGFDLYSSYKVVLNYSGRDPYRYHQKYRVMYPKGYKGQQGKPQNQNKPHGNSPK